MATLADVARRAGVSKSTVSRVVRGAAHVSDKVRSRVLRAIEDTDYRPNELARGLVTGAQRLAAVIVPDIRIEFFARVVHGVEEALRPDRYLVLVLNSGEGIRRLRECVSAAMGTRVAGIVVVPTGPDRELRRTFASLPVPAVSVIREPWAAEVDAVSYDNRAAGYMAAEHLLDLGHREVAYLEGPHASKAVRLRTDGFLQALRDRDLKLPDALRGVGDLTYGSGRKQAAEWIASGLRFTAAFAANDAMALGIIDQLTLAGIHVPDDVSVIGVDDSLAASWPTVNLTTVREVPEEMGSRAALILRDRIEGWKSPPVQLVFRPELIRRATTRPVKVHRAAVEAPGRQRAEATEPKERTRWGSAETR